MSDGWAIHLNSQLGWAMDNMLGPAMGVYGIERCETRLRSMITASHPIVSCVKIKGIDNIIEYPLKKVLQYYDMVHPYFAETVNYIMAWGIMIGVSSFEFHGVDYWGARASERASNEFWAGVAKGKGIDLIVNKESHFLRSGPIDGINRHIPDLYGYMKHDLALSYKYKTNGTIEFTNL